MACEAVARAPELNTLEFRFLDAFLLESSCVLSIVLGEPTGEWLVVRGAFPLTSAQAVPSVIDLWPEARFDEGELRELFGVTSGSRPESELLPEGWEGYPHRKDYLFPSEFSGVMHRRPPGRSEPDEHEVIQ